MDQRHGNDLAAKLLPSLEVAMREITEFGESVATELSKKAASGVAGFGINALRAVGKAAWKQIRSSKAHALFHSKWKLAQSDQEKEEAITFLLSSDPKLSHVLNSLLFRRDFIRAVLEHCNHLPNVSLLDASRLLSEIYVPLSLCESSDAKPADQPSRFRGEDESGLSLLTGGNHVIEGPAGSGKSTLLRHLVASEAQRLLNSPDHTFDETIRIPVFLSATGLSKGNSDFSSALAVAASEEMSVFQRRTPEDHFFNPHAELGGRRWLIGIDGLDEIEDRGKRQKLWDAILLHSQFDDAFRFIVSMRPGTVRFRPSASHVKYWSVQPLADHERKLLAQRYIRQPATTEQFLLLLRERRFSEAATTPLFGAIAASVFDATGDLPTKTSELIDAFIFVLLEKTPHLVDSRFELVKTLLSEIAWAGTFSKPLPDLRQFDPAVKNLPKLKALDTLYSMAERTGLVRQIGGRHVFLHEMFRSFFLSRKLAGQHLPMANVWQAVDPFTVGWSTVEFICNTGRIGARKFPVRSKASFLLEKRAPRALERLQLFCPRLRYRIIWSKKASRVS
jgi:hypothetical protein